MVAKRGQFTASVKIHIDDSNLNKEAQELVKKLGKITDALDVPVGIEYKKGDLEVFQNFMKDIKNADASKFSTTAIRNAVEQLGVSAIKSRDDLEMFKNVYQSFISLLKDGQVIDTNSLVGMASSRQVEYYDQLIAKQEIYIAKQKEAVKINENLEKVAAKKYKEAHQEYIEAPMDKKREFNAARKKLVSAGLYYQSVAQEKYGEGAAETFSYNFDGDTYEPGYDFVEAKKSFELTDKKIKQLVNSVKKEIKDSSATLNDIISQAENKLNELKQTRDVLEKQAVAKVATAPNQKISLTKKNIVKDEIKQDNNVKQDKQSVASQQQLNELKKEENVIEQNNVVKTADNVAEINKEVVAQENLNELKREELILTQQQYETYEKYKKSGFDKLTKNNFYPYIVSDSPFRATKDEIENAWSFYQEQSGLVPYKSHFDWKHDGSPKEYQVLGGHLMGDDTVHVYSKYFDKQLQKVEKLQQVKNPDIEKIKIEIIRLAEYYQALAKSYQTEDIFKGNKALFNEIHSILDVRNKILPEVDHQGVFDQNKDLIKDYGYQIVSEHIVSDINQQQQLNNLKQEEKQIEQVSADINANNIQQTNQEIVAQEKLNNLKKEEQQLEQNIVALEEASITNANQEVAAREAINQNKKTRHKDFYVQSFAGVSKNGLTYEKKKVSGYIDDERQLGIYKDNDDMWQAVDLQTGLNQFIGNTKKELKSIIESQWNAVLQERQSDSAGYQKKIDEFKSLPIADDVVKVKVDNDEASTINTAQEIKTTLEEQSSPIVPVKTDDDSVKKAAKKAKEAIEKEVKFDEEQLNKDLKHYKTPEQRQKENEKKGIQAQYARINKLLNDYVSESETGKDSNKLKTIEKELGEKLKIETGASPRTIGELLKRNLPNGKDATLQAIDKKFGTNLTEIIGNIKPVIKPVVDESATNDAAQKTKDNVEKKAIPDIKPKADESATVVAAEQIEDKVETEAKPVIKPTIDKTVLQEETEKAAKTVSKQLNQATDTSKATVQKSIWEGFENKAKIQALVTDITLKRKTYNKQGEYELYEQIVRLLKSSVDAKTPLDDAQINNLVALVESYKKVSKKDSPNAYILKHRLGVTNFDDVYGGKYGKVKDDYETVMKRAAIAKRQKIAEEKAAETSVQTGVTDTSNLEKVEQNLKDVKVAADDAAISLEKVENVVNTPITAESNEVLRQRLELLGKIIQAYDIFNAKNTLEKSYDPQIFGHDYLGSFSNINSYVNKTDIRYNSRRGGHFVTNTSLESKARMFLDGTSSLDIVAAYVNGYQNIEKAYELFTKAAKSKKLSKDQIEVLWNSITDRITNVSGILETVKNLENKLDSLIDNDIFKSNNISKYDFFTIDDITKKFGMPSLNSIDDVRKEYFNISKQLGKPLDYNGLDNKDLFDSVSYLQNIENQRALIFPSNIKDSYSNYQDIFKILIKIVDLQKQFNENQKRSSNISSGYLEFWLKYNTLDKNILNDGGKIKEFSDINWTKQSSLNYKNFALKYNNDYGTSFEDILKNQFKFDINSEDYKYLLSSLNSLKQSESYVNQIFDELIKLSNITGVGVDNLKAAYERIGVADANRSKDYVEKGGFVNDRMTVSNVSNTSGANAILGQLILSNVLGQRTMVDSGSIQSDIEEAKNAVLIATDKTLTDILKERSKSIIDILQQKEAEKYNNPLLSTKLSTDGVKTATDAYPFAAPTVYSEEESVRNVVTQLINAREQGVVAGESVKAAMGEIKTGADAANESVNNLNNNLDQTSKKSPLVAKQEFEQAAKNTKGFTYKEGSFGMSSKGIITLEGQIEDLDGNLIDATFKFDEFNKAVVDGALNLDYLKEKIKTISMPKGAKKNVKDVVDAEVTEKGKEDKTYSLTANKHLAEVQKYQRVLNTLNSRNLMDKFAVDFNDETQQVITLKEHIDSLKTKILEVQNQLKGKFTSQDALNNKILEYRDLVAQLEGVAKNPIYQKFVDKQGGFFGVLDSGLSDLSKLEIEEKLLEKLRLKYKEVRSLSYDDTTQTATAQVLDDNKIKKVILTLNEYQNELKETATQVRILTGAEKENEKSGVKWLDGLKKKLVSLSQYFTGHMMIMRIINQVRSGFQFVKELDSQLTTINQTMSVTEEQLKGLGDASIETAKNLGTTAENVLKAVAIYANANETAESILNKAQPTIMLANASGADTSTAADQIQGVVQQFEELEGQERRIVNSYEKISAGLAIDFATGINRMAEGVQTAGSVVEAAGMKFETFAASVGKISERTRQEGSSIGNAYKTIMARISRSQSADEDVTDEDRSNASKAFSSVGISLYNSAGEYKDINETLDELVSIWDELTDAQRNYIAEQAAGVRNINVFTQLIETWGEAKELANDAMTDTDFIDETQVKYMESMAAHINTLKSSLQGFWNTLLDTEILNLGLDLLTGAVKLVDHILSVAKDIGGVFHPWVGSLTAAASLIGMIIGGYSTGKSVKDLLGIVTKKDAVNGLTEAINKNTAAQVANNVAGAEGAKINAQQAASENIEAGAKATNTAATEGQTAAESANIASKVGNKISTTFTSMSAASQAAGGGIKGVVAGLKALVASVGTVTAVVAGVAAVAAMAYTAFDALTDSTKETAEAVEKLNENFQETKTELANAASVIAEVKDEYETLSKGVNLSTGENISLTIEEYDRYLNVCNQIADIYPNLVRSYDEQGNAILTLKGNIEALNEAYDQQRLSAAQDYLGNLSNGKYENLELLKENFSNVTGDRSVGTKMWDSFWDFGRADIGGKITAQEAANALEEIQTMSLDELKDWMSNEASAEINSWLYRDDTLNLDDVITGMTEEQWHERARQIPTLLSNINSDVKEEADALKEGLRQYLTILELNDPDFKHIDDGVFSQISNMISGMSSEQLAQLQASGEIENYIRNLINTLGNNITAKNNLVNLTNINRNSSVSKMSSILGNDFDSLLTLLGYDKNNEDDRKSLAQQLGIEDVLEVVNEYDDTLEHVNENVKKMNKEYDDSADYTKDISEFIEDAKINTKNELALLKKCSSESDTWAETMHKFTTQSLDLNSFASEIEELEKDVAKFAESLDTISEAKETSFTSTGLSIEDVDALVKIFGELESYDYDELFEATAEGIKLNTDELQRLQEEYNKLHLDQYTEQLEDLQKAYGNVCAEINNATDPTIKNSLIEQRDTLAGQINDVQSLISYYDGLTNAVTKYVKALDSTDKGNVYDSIYDSLEDIVALYDKGLTGKDDFKEFANILSYSDMSDATNVEAIDQYEKQIKLAKSWLTEDAVGIRNFFNDLTAKGFAESTGTDSWSFGDINIEEIAKEFDVSTALIEEMFNKAQEYGAEGIKYVDTESWLYPMQQAAKEAQESLKALGSEDIGLDVGLVYDMTSALDDLTPGTQEYRDALKSAEKAINDEINVAKDLLKSDKLTTEQKEALTTQVYYAEAALGELANKMVDINSVAGLTAIDAAINRLIELETLAEDFEINWNNSDVLYFEGKLGELQGALEKLKVDGKIPIEWEGYDDAWAALEALYRKIQATGETPVVLSINTTAIEDEATKAGIEYVQTIQSLVREKEIQSTVAAQMGVEADTSALDKQIEDTVAKLTENCPTVAGKLGFDVAKTVADVETQLKNIEEHPELIVEAGVDSTLVDKYIKAEHKTTGSVAWDNDTRLVDAYAGEIKHAEGLVEWKNDTTNVKDNFTASGTTTSTASTSNTSTIASSKKKVYGLGFAKGTQSAKQSGLSLVGELGRELIVRGKRFFTVGDNGAEMFDVHKNDIIFNHKQTEELLSNGSTSSRGNLVGGDAFAQGNAYAGEIKINGGASVTLGYSGSGSKMYDSGDSDKPSEDDFDWIEVVIQRIEEAIARLDIVAGSAYKNFTKRNNKLVEEFSLVKKQIDIQNQAYNAYMREAESISLSESYKQKVRDGVMDIEVIVDNEDLVEAINDYQDLYNKAIEAKDKVLELEETLGDIAKAKFDNIQSEFDELIAKIEDAIDLTESGLDIVEAKGQFASEQYFKTLMSIEKENIAMIEKEYVALNNAYKEAMATGTIEEGSEAWYEMQQQIRDTEKALQDANLSLIEFKNEMWEMDWSIFDYYHEQISKLTEESEFLIDLLSLNENDLFGKESGLLTDAGNAVGGLHAMNYNTYMAQAEEYEKKVKEINEELAKDPNNTILIDKKNEYIAAQQDAIKAANDEKMAIHDLIEESYNRQLEILQELIDKRKEYLQAEKDVYDYEKNVAEQTKQITSYQKQLAAISGDDSEEAKSKRQQLQTSLEEAQSNLEDTEYDRWLSDQEKLMDDLYSDYEEVLNERLDNIDGLLQDMIDSTNANSETINDTINSAAGDVGYNVTDGMASIWDNTESGIGKVVTEFSDNFTATLTTTNNYIKSIYDLINKNVEKSDKEITANTKPSTTVSSGSSSSGSSSGSSSSGSSTISSSSSSSSKNKGWFFVHKKDSYPKNQLSIDTSIVDRLKWNDFDTSWSNMAAYYEGMGLGKRSAYKGTAQQNVAMLSWMRKNGFRRSGQLSSMMNTAQEDGLFLGRKDDYILSERDWKIASDMVTKLIDFGKMMPIVRPIQPIEKSSIGDVNLTLNLPNVTNSDEFVDFLKSKKAQNVIQSYTTDLAIGKNSLSKYKYK